MPSKALDPLGQPPGQRHAAGGDAEQHGVGGAVGLLENLVRDAVDDALHVGAGQNDLYGRLVPALPVSGTGPAACG